MDRLRGSENKEQFIHMVSEQITAKFHNDCKEVTWFFETILGKSKTNFTRP